MLTSHKAYKSYKKVLFVVQLHKQTYNPLLDAMLILTQFLCVIIFNNPCMDGLNLPELIQANSHTAKHVNVATKGFVCGADRQVTFGWSAHFNTFLTPFNK
jgi:hypothetical protein